MDLVAFKEKVKYWPAGADSETETTSLPSLTETFAPQNYVKESLLRDFYRTVIRRWNWFEAFERRTYLGLILLLSAYCFWFIGQSARLYYGYSDPPFDLSIFNQGLWLITHGHGLFVTIMGRSLFGDHSSFILLLFAPFYTWFPEPMGLLVLQTLLLASAAIPIYLIARKYLESARMAVLIAAAYLMNPLIQQGNVDQFHPESFMVPILAMAMYAAIENRMVVLFFMCELALLVKEDAAAFVIPLAIWVMWRRNFKVGARIAGLAVVWLAVVTRVIIPDFLGASSFYSGRLPFGGWSGTLHTLVRTPGTFFNYLLSDGRWFFAWQMVAPTGAVALLAPEIALIAGGGILENMLSNDPYMHAITFQYTMAVAPVMAMAAVWAIRRNSNLIRRWILVAVVTLSALWTCALWGYAPFSTNKTVQYLSPSSSQVTAVHRLERLIPSNAMVSAWYPLSTHLDLRTNIYVWPNPFYASNWGLENNPGAYLPISQRVQYLFLPSSLSDPTDIQVFKTLEKKFKLLKSEEGFNLYKRK
jgi:uncharacterized membrane protein